MEGYCNFSLPIKKTGLFDVWLCLILSSLFILNRVSRDFLCTIIIMTLIFLCIKYKFKSFKNKFHNRVYYLPLVDNQSMLKESWVNSA